LERKPTGYNSQQFTKHLKEAQKPEILHFREMLMSPLQKPLTAENAECAEKKSAQSAKFSPFSARSTVIMPFCKRVTDNRDKYLSLFPACPV
jgi:hypothetical protein